MHAQACGSGDREMMISKYSEKLARLYKSSSRSTAPPAAGPGMPGSAHTPGAEPQ
jgi:hypothetical protein